MKLNTIYPTDENTEKIDVSVVKTKSYESGNWTFVCNAEPGTNLGSASWHVIRLTDDGTDVLREFADGNTEFDNVATSLAAVSGLSYS